MLKPLPYWGVWFLVNMATLAASAATERSGWLLAAVCTMLAFNLAYLAFCLRHRRRERSSGPA